MIIIRVVEDRVEAAKAYIAEHSLEATYVDEPGEIDSFAFASETGLEAFCEAFVKP